ncbi:hypothetical protein BDW22DRAFT_1344395 [Trametopsis cervina]|nr:hypothetical protein BDW22DRAFT_1344395 [Trametopsis cervina]
MVGCFVCLHKQRRLGTYCSRNATERGGEAEQRVHPEQHFRNAKMPALNLQAFDASIAVQNSLLEAWKPVVERSAVLAGSSPGLLVLEPALATSSEIRTPDNLCITPLEPCFRGIFGFREVDAAAASWQSPFLADKFKRCIMTPFVRRSIAEELSVASTALGGGTV